MLLLHEHAMVADSTRICMRRNTIAGDHASSVFEATDEDMVVMPETSKVDSPVEVSAV